MSKKRYRGLTGVTLSHVVAVMPSGKLVLSCGHLTDRPRRRSLVLCEKCFPEVYARLRAQYARGAHVPA